MHLQLRQPAASPTVSPPPTQSLFSDSEGDNQGAQPDQADDGSPSTSTDPAPSTSVGNTSSSSSSTPTPSTSTVGPEVVPTTSSTPVTSSQIPTQSSSTETSAAVSTSPTSDSLTISTSQTLVQTTGPPTPITTIAFTGDIVQGNTGPSVISTLPYQPSSSSQPVSAADTGFWQHKSAVAGTFIVVVLLSLGLAFAGLIVYRRRRRSQYESDDYFEKPLRPQSPVMGAQLQSQSDLHRTPSGHTQASHTSSAAAAGGAEVASHYHDAPSLPYPFFAINVIPEPGHTDAYTPHQDLFTTHPDIPAAGGYTSKAGLNLLRPHPARNIPAGRGSYQPSIDSFYGGQGMSTSA